MRTKRLFSAWFTTVVVLLATPSCIIAQQQYVDHSLLAVGEWYKIPVSSTGVYKITTNEIAALQGVECSDIALYGDAGGMLSTNNTVIYTDDMVPAAVEVVDVNQNGVFDNVDYILFYGEGPNVWRYNKTTRLFEYYIHAYANNNYYYLTVDGSTNTPLRIAQQESTNPAPYPYEISNHTGVALVHEDRINVFSGGRTWVENKLTNSYNQRVCNFTFPTIDGTVLARYGLANVSSNAATFSVSTSTGASQTHRLFSGEDYQAFYATFSNMGESFSVTFTYTPQESNAAGYFDYIELNGTQNMVYSGGQSFFRNQQLLPDGATCPFYFSGGSAYARKRYTAR